MTNYNQHNHDHHEKSNCKKIWHMDNVRYEIKCGTPAPVFIAADQIQNMGETSLLDSSSPASSIDFS